MHRMYKMMHANPKSFLQKNFFLLNGIPQEENIMRSSLYLSFKMIPLPAFDKEMLVSLKKTQKTNF